VNGSDEVNRNIEQLEIEDGVRVDGLSDDMLPEVEARNRWYTMLICGVGKELIWGHPHYCPEPVPVRIKGSTWGGSMLKVRYIGQGMRLEFRHPVFHTILTSRIVDIRASEQVASDA